MKERLLLFLMWVFPVLAVAIPARRVTRTITLADGTKKEVILQGDEHVHFYLDAEGCAYVEDSNGLFVPTDKLLLQRKWDERLTTENQRRMAKAKGRANASPSATRKRSAIVGHKKGLVILVEFSNLAMKPSHSASFYDRFFNSDSFSEEDICGSVHRYFWECSYGQFDLTFDVVGPVVLDKPYSYYGENNYSGDDKHAAEMVREACEKAEELGTDFSRYDWDGDGEVDQVFVLYAGHGENQGASSNTVWPHEFTLSGAATWGGDGEGSMRLDGVVVDTYAVSCELCGSSGSRADGIGTACHEFSHCLGLPDAYDTSYTQFGMNVWDLMDYGNYSGPGYNSGYPTTLTSFERMLCGWLNPVELTTGRMVTDMACLTDKPEAYIIYNEANRNEFYLLENRQQVGFDSYLPGHGMMVLHVDYDEEVWWDNTVNSGSVQRMTIIPADGHLSTGSSQLAGDLWPGTSRNRSLTDTSSPAATLNRVNKDGRKFMGKPIEDITEDTQQGTISFRFCGGDSLDMPEGLVLAEVQDGGSAFTVQWQPVDGASSYEVNLKQCSADDALSARSVLLKETFSKFVASSLYSSNYQLDSVIDRFMETAGWRGVNAYYTAKSEIRLGSNTQTGKLVTPALNSNAGTVTICVTVHKYENDTGLVNVIINDKKVGQIKPTQDKEVYVYSVPVSETFKVTFETSAKRVFVGKLAVFDGTYDEAVAKQMLLRDDYMVTEQYTTSDLSYAFTNMNPSFVYEVQVRGMSNIGTGKWSLPLSVDLATGIRPLCDADDTVRSSVVVYDLCGRPMPNAGSKGIYVRNRRKYVRK